MLSTLRMNEVFVFELFPLTKNSFFIRQITSKPMHFLHICVYFYHHLHCLMSSSSLLSTPKEKWSLGYLQIFHSMNHLEVNDSNHQETYWSEPNHLSYNRCETETCIIIYWYRYWTSHTLMTQSILTLHEV